MVVWFGEGAAIGTSAPFVTNAVGSRGALRRDVIRFTEMATHENGLTVTSCPLTATGLSATPLGVWRLSGLAPSSEGQIRQAGPASDKEPAKPDEL